MTTSPFAPKQGETLTLRSTVRLQDGTEQPRLGIGAWAMRGDEAYESLRHALDSVGYRHIDTARYYRNEEQVGAAIRASTLDRDEIYATTKLYIHDMSSSGAIDEALRKSGLSYWNLVLLHAPDGGREARLRSWAALSKYVDQGKIRSLGVSNYGPQHIRELLDSPQGQRIKPVVNQIECHPFFAQREVRKACEDSGIVIQAYCPLARGQYFGDATLQRVAQRNGKSEAQVMLRWLLQHGMIPLPKSSNEKRQVENAESLSFELSADDMQLLDSLDRGDGGSVEVQSMSQRAP